MDDHEVLGRINELAGEEHELFRDGRAARRGSTRTKHGFETRKPSRDTRPDDA
jgi:hypothetical protein